MAITPEQKWKSSILEYRKKCLKIMKISDSIRYVGVINEYGRTLTGMITPKIKPLLKAEDVKNEFFIISTLMTLRKVFDKSLEGTDPGKELVKPSPGAFKKIFDAFGAKLPVVGRNIQPGKFISTSIEGVSLSLMTGNSPWVRVNISPDALEKMITIAEKTGEIEEPVLSF